jgi:hypothetical protein
MNRIPLRFSLPKTLSPKKPDLVRRTLEDYNMSKHTFKILTILVAILGVFPAAACGPAGIGTSAANAPNVTVGSPTPSAALNFPTTVPPTPTLDPNRAIGVNLNEDAIDTPPEFFGHYSTLVVTGHVTQILPAQWATQDGKPPADPVAAAQSDSLHSIITPVVITLDGPPVVDHAGFNPAQKTIVVSQPGGTVGMLTVTTSGHAIIFELGERVLVALNELPGSNGTLRLIPTPAGLAWDVAGKYPITADGNAVVNGTPIPETDVIERIKTAADASQATPTP